MKSGIHKSNITLAGVILAVYGFGLFVSVANAADKDKATLDKVLITGSHIKRTDFEGPSPVLVIDEEDIASSGTTDLNGLLSKLTINNGFMLNENEQALSAMPGGAGINLHGLGQDATLVLINGRRISNYPFALDTTDSFVDLNSIPLAMVERVEVLKDGASALYGSDALAGVINIILRSDYDGTEVTASYGVSSEGDANETRLNFAKGISSDDQNITFIFDYFKRDSFLLADRDYSSSALLKDGTDYTSMSAYPASYLLFPSFTPTATSISTFNPNDYMTSVPQSERISGMFSFKKDISTDLSFFTDVSLSQNTTKYFKSPTPFVSNDIPDLLLPSHPSHPGGAVTDPLVLFWRMTELGPRIDENKTDVYRIVAGFEGVVNDWDWEAAVFKSGSKSVLTGTNYASLSAIQTSLAAGLLDPLDNIPGPSPQSELDAVRASISRNAETDLKGTDIKFTGEVGQMDAGPVQLAIGLSYLGEELSDKPDAVTASGDIVGQGSTSSEGSRNSKALFAELNLPLQENIELQLALRGEDYSDFGSTVNPKIAIKYQPSSTVMLRASAGTGFRAPSLQELHQGDTTVFGFYVDTARCDAIGGVECNLRQVEVLLSSNPDLDAEESTSFYLGVVFEPLKDFSVGIDYWNYDQDNIVAQNTQQTIDENDPTKVIRSAPLNPILGVFDSYMNSANRKTDGIDLDIQYSWNTGVGKFHIKSTTTKVFSAKEKIRDIDAYIDYAGKYRNPDLRSNLSLGWKITDYAAVISANYIDSYEDLNYNTDGHMVDSQLTYNGQLKYSGFKETTIVFGINNILNEDPPFSNASYAGYDAATHNPIGRFYYLRLNHQF